MVEKSNKKFFRLAPQRHKDDEALPPAPLMGLTSTIIQNRQGEASAIRGGFASFSEYFKPQQKKHCSVDRFCYLCTANRIMLVYNATKRVGEELPMRFSIDRILKIDI